MDDNKVAVLLEDFRVKFRTYRLYARVSAW